MKRFYLPSILALLIVAALAIIGCGANPTPTPIPATAAPTIAPTSAPPTAVPTAVPPTSVPATAAPTTAAAKTSTSGSITGSEADTKAVIAAFQKFLSATTFRMDADVTTSPSLFQAKYEPQPGDDPNVVTVVAMQGEQDNSNFDFTLRGFAASFIAVFAGFNPDVPSIRLVSVDGTNYVNAVKEGEKEAKWYRMAESDTTTSGFAPQQLLAPAINGKYADNAFGPAGTEVVDQKNCTIYQGDRAAFDLILSEMSESALLNSDAYDANALSTNAFKVWVCDDGNVHRLQYSFQAPLKSDATKKGNFEFEAHLKDYDAAIVIKPPTDAIAFENPAAATSEPDATATPIVAGNFSTLEGDWEGTIGGDRPLQFTVEDNAITLVNLNYAINTGGCSSSGSFGKSVEDASITDSEFDFVLTDSDDVKYNVKGNFDSNNKATGTVTIQGKTFCGDTNISDEWTASHVSSPDQPTPTEIIVEEPTDEPTPDEFVVSGARIVGDAFEALGRKDIAAALSLFDDDVIYNVGTTSGIGKDSLQSYMELASAAGATFKISNVQEVGGIVTFTVTVSGIGAGTYSNSSAIVEDGKISILTIK